MQYISLAIMRSNLFILCCCITLQFSLVSNAQDVLTAESFFNQIPAPTVIQSSAPSLSLPLIDNYEIRTRTDEFDFSRQLYTFRLSPSTFKRRNAQLAIYEHLAQKPDFNQEVYFCDLVKTLNEDWLKITYLKNRVKLLDSLESNFRYREYILKNESQSLIYKNNNLVENEIENTAIKLENYKHQSLLSDMLKRYSALDVLDSFYNFLSLSEIKTNLSIDVEVNLNGLLAEDQYKSDLLQKEIDLEQAERDQLFDFLQFRYQGPDTDPFRERFSVGVALKLNKTSQSKLKIAELRLEQEETQTEMRWDELDARNKLQSIRDALNKDILYVEFYSQSITEERNRLESIKQKILLSNDFDPMLLIEIQERAIINQLKLLDLYFDIYSDYIDFIHRSGNSCGTDQVNWLDRI